MTEYEYRTAPYAHQRKLFEETRELFTFAFFWEPGVGKSKIIIDTTAWLYEAGKITALLIIAPNGVHLNWIRNEIPRHLPDRIPHHMLAWDSAHKSRSYTKALMRLFDATSELKIFALNVESLSVARGRDMSKKFLRRYPASLTVIDESSRIKSHSAKRTKATLSLRELTAYRRILTGTPVTQSPLDVYTQLGFLDPRVLGYSSWFAFRNRYAQIVTKRAVDGGGRVYKYEDIIGYRNLAELQRKVSSCSSRLTKAECLDLPERIFTQLPVPMAPEQGRLYRKLVTELVIESEGAELPVAMALTRLMRLQQLTGGHIATESGTVVPIIGKNPKLDMLLADIEDAGQSVQAVIWARFVPELHLITDALRERYGRDAVGLYCGETPRQERAELVDAFQAGQVRFFVGNPQTAGMGLTLTAASTVYYFSNDFSLENRLQSTDRCHRIGQHKVVVYKDIVCIDTVDERVLAVLNDKKSLSDVVTGDNLRGFV